MLSVFDILKPLNKYGAPVDLEYDFSLTLYACIGLSPIKTISLLTVG